MQFYGALVLFVTLGAALGLQCYSCVGENCTDKITCIGGADRCSTIRENSVVSKGCMMQAACKDPIKCCATDLCNSALPNGPSSIVLLLLVTSAIITVFL